MGTKVGTFFAVSLLAFLLSFQAQVQASCVVLDPFVYADPIELDFGAVEVGESKTLDLDVSYLSGRTYCYFVPGVGVECGACACNCGNPQSATVSYSTLSGVWSHNGAGGNQLIVEGDHKIVKVTFTPSSEQLYAQEFTISNNIHGAVKVQLQGIGYVPQANIQLNKTNVSFEATSVGSSPTQILQISNEGDLTLTGSLSKSGPFNVSSTNFSVSPGSTRNITVTYLPNSRGSHVGSITVNSNDPDSSQLVVDLAGVAVAPKVTFTPSSENFGNVPVNETATATLTVKNEHVFINGADYSAPLYISSITTTNSQYTVLPTSAANILPGASQEFTLRFKPNSSTNSSAVVSVHSNDPSSPSAMSASGVGVSAKLDLSTLTLNFGKVALGQSKNLGITVTNTGALGLTVSNITSSDADITVSPKIFSLAAGQQRTVTVTLSPDQTGHYDDTITFFSNDPGAPSLQVTINGEGTNPIFSAPTLSYGNVYINSDHEQIMKVVNQGNGTLQVSNITSSSNLFVPEVKVFLVPPSSSFDVPVTFRSSSTGNKSATFTFYTNQYGQSTKQVQLNATAVSDLDLFVENVEVTQAIQTVDNQLPLVQGKAMMVRVYAGAEVQGNSNFSGLVRNVDAKLRVYRDNIELAGSPFKSTLPMHVSANMLRNSSSSSINFYIPPYLSFGQFHNSPMRFEVELNPSFGSHVVRLEENDYANNQWSDEFTVYKQYSPLVDSIPVSYLGNGMAHQEDIQEQVDFLEKLFPTSSIRLRQRPPIQYNRVVNVDNNPCQGGLDLMAALFYAAHLGNMSPADRVYGWMPKNGVRCGCAIVSSRIGYGDAGTSGCQSTFAHEIGHTYGLCHTHNVDGFNGCYDGHSIDQVDLDETGFDPEAGIIKSTKYYHDFMSYEYNPWIHSARYQTLFDILRTQSEDPVLNEGRVYLVTGDITQAGSGKLRPAYQQEAALIPQLNEDVDSDYVVRGYSADDKLLWEYGVENSLEASTPVGDDQELTVAPFALAIAEDEDLSRLELLFEGSIIDSISRTMVAPSITIQEPRAGDQIADLLHVSWLAEDSDSEELTYSVLFSQDGGTTYTVIGTELHSTDFEYVTEFLPGSDNAWVQVVATDGLNTSRHTVGPITITNKAPTVFIQSPTAGSVFAAGATVHFAVKAQDLEDGTIHSSSIEWISDRDGSLGVGETLAVNTLSHGHHVIRVIARDSQSLTAEKQVSLQILNAGQDPLVSIAALDAVSEGAVFELDGSASAAARDDEVLTYQWQQISGPTAVMTAAERATASVQAPQVDDDETMQFQLTVTDTQGYSSTGVIELTVTNDVFAELELGATLVDFGTVSVGAEGRQSVVLKNIGQESLKILGVYSRRDVFTNDSAEMTIEPQQSVTLSLIFSPDEEAQYESFMTVQSNSIGGVERTIVLRARTDQPVKFYDDYGAGGSLLPTALNVTPSEPEAAQSDERIAENFGGEEGLSGEAPSERSLIGGSGGCSLILH